MPRKPALTVDAIVSMLRVVRVNLSSTIPFLLRAWRFCGAVRHQKESLSTNKKQKASKLGTPDASKSIGCVVFRMRLVTVIRFGMPDVPKSKVFVDCGASGVQKLIV